MTDVDRKTKNIVVRCLRPYKGYGLPREREIADSRAFARLRCNLHCDAQVAADVKRCAAENNRTC